MVCSIPAYRTPRAQLGARADDGVATVQHTSASPQEIAASAQELSKTAEELERLVGQFRLVR